MGKSNMELLYEKYINSDNITINKNGVEYYKIFYKGKLSAGEEIRIVITVPDGMFLNKKGKYIEDENGKRIKLDQLAHMSFGNGIPEWYLNTLTFGIIGMKDITDIGEYVRLVESE